MTQTVRPHGCWPSPVTAEHVAAAGRKFSDLNIDPAHPDTLYWVESRPEEAGRCTIMRQHPGESCKHLLDAPFSANSRVHEYGGGSFIVHDGVVWFVNAADQAIYRRGADGDVTCITGTDEPSAYADLQYDNRRNQLIAVAEKPRDHDEPRASLVQIAADGDCRIIADGHDFIASPRLSPAGDRLVWLTWNHPDMPWDNTQLWQAPIGDDGIGTPQCCYAGDEESLFGPFFDSDGRLYIVSDADDWWNVYRETSAGDFPQLTHEKAEFGVPQWVFGQKTCAFDSEGRLFALSTRDGLWRLGRVDTSNSDSAGQYTRLPVDATHMEQLVATAQGLALVAGDAATAKRIIRLDGVTRDNAAVTEVVRAASGLPDAARLSRPEPMAYTTAHGETAHALFYPPAHAECSAPPGERPPLLIKCHGGPTGATGTALDARIQYWTTRGYAVLDVNYRGSTGYGRAYRNKLDGNWGLADVEDCVYGARELADAGRIDARRVLISGSSAGGYTVLCVLTFTDLAAAGASYYGIGDLKRLLDSTHKFESRYLKRLIGDTPGAFDTRSPLKHADNLSCPVLFLQGQKDKVVPPEQAETMAAALREHGVPVSHVTFEDERHGFRDADNIVHAIEAERSFYQRVLELPCRESGVALVIDNFPDGE